MHVGHQVAAKNFAEHRLEAQSSGTVSDAQRDIMKNKGGGILLIVVTPGLPAATHLRLFCFLFVC